MQYKLAENVLFQRVAQETVILEPETGQYYTLDEVGTFMVEYLQQGKSINEIVNCVLDNYQASEEEVLSDLNELLKHMLTQGLLVEVS